MATTFLGWRPSPLAAACAPSSLATAAQPYALGQMAVSTVLAGNPAGAGFKVRTAPIFGHPAVVGGAVKINNSISTIAAVAVEGATTSNLLPTSSAAPAQMQRVQKVQDDKVKGGNARGNPPRGRPV